MATLKWDGLFFVMGCLVGIFIFGETVEYFTVFWERAGFLDRFLLPEWLGLETGTVIFLVVLMAIGMFWIAEKIETLLSTTPRVKSRYSYFKWIGITLLLLLTFCVNWIGQPSLEMKMARLPIELLQKFQERAFHIDPKELLDLMHNNQIRLLILDVREDADYNLFHLKYSHQLLLEELKNFSTQRFPNHAVKVLVSNGESKANRAWTCLAAQKIPNIYILEGGINQWLEIYTEASIKKKRAENISLMKNNRPFEESDEALHYEFPMALGSRYSNAKPESPHEKKRLYSPKVQIKKPISNKGGGCG